MLRGTYLGTLACLLAGCADHGVVLDLVGPWSAKGTDFDRLIEYRSDGTFDNTARLYDPARPGVLSRSQKDSGTWRILEGPVGRTTEIKMTYTRRQKWNAKAANSTRAGTPWEATR